MLHLVNVPAWCCNQHLSAPQKETKLKELTLLHDLKAPPWIGTLIALYLIQAKIKHNSNMTADRDKKLQKLKNLTQNLNSQN